MCNNQRFCEGCEQWLPPEDFRSEQDECAECVRERRHEMQLRSDYYATR